ncbi:uncharacterized protein LOC120074858 [Benincasa hispida]|uniref:uncharacterized protein LOC120074858 n=1 Tax=Benincasa hispida TaxID=102211 RepID=UPI0019012A5B|nr:uncharacterized protein LOC120074858 [Benincasa hispida]
MEDRVFDRIAQRLATSVRSIQTDPDKKFDVERLKALSATMLDGAIDPVDAKVWLDLIEKCFNVIRCPKDHKVRLSTFLLQKGAEKWWKVILAKRSSSEAMTWPEFRQVFADKYYPSAFKKAKREEFLRLTQGSMTVVEYEQRFTELSQNCEVLLGNQSSWVDLIQLELLVFDVILGKTNVVADALSRKTRSARAIIFTVRDDILREQLGDSDLQKLAEEAHSLANVMHPGSTKVYKTLKKSYLWPGMKREIAEYVDRCLVCQQVKPERQRPTGLLNPLLTAKFLPIKVTSTLDQLAKLYNDRIVSQFGALVSIVSDRDSRFTSKFWPSLQKVMGTKLYFSTAFHPQTDVTIQVLEWHRMRLYMEDHVELRVKNIKENLKTAGDRQKSYADKRRRELEFEVGDKVFLKLSPWKGILRFRRKGKLSPRYIRPYEIIERVDPMAYRLELPLELSRIHDVFHVSMLRKYVLDPTHVLPEQPVQLKENLSYEEEPVKILDRKEQVLRNKTISLVKVLWQNHSTEEVTWEAEEQMKNKYLQLFN